jgi:KUP system potassium uptake protein
MSPICLRRCRPLCSPATFHSDSVSARHGQARLGPRGRLATLSVAAVGVVYGDIGTSPLYAIRECFFGDDAVAATTANVRGVLSLVTWSLLLVISIKYLAFILRADHDGEGGILALMELVKKPLRGTPRKLVLGLGLFGAALLYGDGMITPAISVLSATEGLQVATSRFDAFVIPLTLVILAALFSLQRLGTGGVGRLFGPIMTLWFLVLAAGGVHAIAQLPEVLYAVNPIHGFRFFVNNGMQALTILGIVFLVVTGGEALYADLGHFGARPIRLSWYVLVLPSLLLNYFGQGALILRRGGDLANPFYELFPTWSLYPMVVLASAATIIASQAIISGVFSLTVQGIHLGYLPRVNILHTSREQRGQIYVPAMNWLLLAATLGLVLSFRTSGNLVAAYGMAITATMLITTILFVGIARHALAWPLPRIALVMLVFLIVDLGFLAANLGKLPSGGWFPLLVGGFMLLLMTTWRRGQQLEKRLVRDRAEPLVDFLAGKGGGFYRRVPGQAVYLTENEHGTPHALEYNLQHNRALHEFVVIYTPKFMSVPYVRPRDRYSIERLRRDIVRIVSRRGFMEQLDAPADLADIERAKSLGLKLDALTYFVSDEIVLATEDVGMPAWRAWLYAFMQRNARRGARHFQLPPDQVFEIGTQIPV